MESDTLIVRRVFQEENRDSRSPSARPGRTWTGSAALELNQRIMESGSSLCFRQSAVLLALHGACGRRRTSIGPARGRTPRPWV